MSNSHGDVNSYFSFPSFYSSVLDFFFQIFYEFNDQCIFKILMPYLQPKIKFGITDLQFLDTLHEYHVFHGS